MKNDIPSDAREVYLDEETKEPIAFCPKDGLGATDLERALFFDHSKEWATEKAKKVRVNNWTRTHFLIVISVDDPTWKSLADFLMPNNDATWEAMRKTGQVPIARGIVAKDPGFLRGIDSIYPAEAGKLGKPPPNGKVHVAVMCAGGFSVFEV